MKDNLPRALPYNLPIQFPDAARSRQFGQTKVNRVFNYNDPNQVNSWADVITKSLNPSKNEGNAFTSFLSNSWDLVKHGTIDPIKAGDFKAFGLNTLMNFSETMDIVAAPTKALLQGNGIEGAKKALGIGIEGRQNYDWNVKTGNAFGDILANFMLELVSDPVNWVTFGLKGVATSAAKSAIKETMGTVAKDLGMELNQQAYKTVSKKLVQSYLDKDIDAFTKTSEDMMSWMRQEGFLMDYSKTTTEQFHKALVNAEQTAFGTMGANIIRGVNNVSKKAESAEKVLVRTALTPGIYPTYFALKKGGVPLASYVSRQMRTVGHKYSRPDGAMSFANMDDFMPVIKQHQNNLSMIWEKVSDEKDVPKETLRELTKGVERDYITIQGILRNNVYDAEKAVADIAEYLQKMTGGKCSTVSEYLAVVEKANADYLGVFGLHEQLYRDLQDLQENILKINETLETTKHLHTIDKSLADSFKELAAVDMKANPVHQSFLKYIDDSEEVFLNYMDNIDKETYYAALKYADNGIINNMHEFRKAAHKSEKIGTDTNTINKMLRVAKGQVKRKSDRTSQLVLAVQNSLKTERGFQEFYYNMIWSGNELYQPYLEILEGLKQSLANLYQLPMDDNMKHLIPLSYDLYTALAKDIEINQKYMAEAVYEWLSKLRDTGVYQSFSLNGNHYMFQRTMKAYAKYTEALKALDTLDLDKPTTNHFADLVNNSTNLAEANAKVNKMMESPLNVNGNRTEEVLQRVSKKNLRNVQKKIAETLGIDLKRDDVTNYVDELLTTDSLTLSDRERDVLSAFLSFKIDKTLRENPNALSDYASMYNDVVHLFNSRLTELFEDRESITVQNRIAEYTDLLQALENVNPVKYDNVYLQDESKTVLTQFQMEKFNATLQLSTNGVVGDFLAQLRTKTGPFGHAIDAIKADTSDTTLNLRMAIEALEMYAKSNYSYQKLLNRLAFLKIPDNIKFAFASSLQNFAKMDPGRLMSNPYYFDQLMQATEDHLFSAYGNTRGAIDYFRMKLVDSKDKWGKARVFNNKSEWESEWLYDIFVKRGHNDARSDVLMTELIIEEEMPEIVEQLKVFNRPIYVADIETTGLNYNADQVIQLAFREYGSPLKDTHQLKQLHAPEYFDNDANFPSLAVLQGLYGDKPLAELKQLYKSDYSSEAARDITHQANEEVLLRRALKQLPEDAIILWHNGDNFDIPMMLRRMEKNAIDTRPFKQFLHVDTLSQYKKKQGGIAVSQVAYRQLREIMDDYAAELAEQGSQHTVELNVQGMLRTLKELSRSFKEMFDRNTNTGVLTEYIDVIDEMSQQIGDVLRDIDNSNIALKNVLVNNVTQADIKDITGEELQKMFDLTDEEVNKLYGPEIDRTFYDLIQTKYRTKLIADMTGDTVENVTAKYGAQINLTRVLRGDSSVTQYGYKNVYNSSEVQRFFTYEQTKVPVSTLTQMYFFTKAVNRLANKQLKNTNYLHNLDLTTAIRALKDFAVEKQHPLQLIDPDKILGTTLQYATLHEMWKQLVLSDLYKSFKRKGLDKEDFMLTKDVLFEQSIKSFPQIPRDVLEVLVDPMNTHTVNLFGYGAISRERQLAVKTKAQAEKPAYKWMQIYDEAQKKFEGLSKLSRALDDNKNWTAKGYAISVISQPLMRALDRFMKLAPAQQDAHIALQRNAKEAMATVESCEILSRAITEPDFLISTLLYDSPFMVFSTKGFTDAKEYNDLLRIFLSKIPFYEEQGIVTHLTDTFIYVGLKNDIPIHTNDIDGFKIAVGRQAYEQPQHRELKVVSPGEVKLPVEDVAILQNIREQLAQLSSGRSVGTIGGVLNAATLNKLYDRLPKAFKEQTIDIQKMYDIGFFNGIRFNRIMQGPVQYRADFTDMLDEELLLNNIKALQHVASLTEQKYLYTDMYFNHANGFGLDETGIFKDLPDEEVVEILRKSDTMIVAYLVSDNSAQGYHVRPVTIKTVEDLQFARANNSVCVPYQVYAASFKKINEQTFDNRFLSAWQKVIYLFKVGYLVDPGVFLRNYLDSTLKTGLMTKDPLGTVQSQIQACSYLEKHSRVIRDIVQRYPTRALNDTTKAYYFSMLAESDRIMTKKEFDFVDGFLSYGPSAGETKALQEVMKAKGYSHAQETAWGKFVAFADTMLTPTARIEQIARLGEYIQLTKAGATRTDAIMQVQRTHFDYSVKGRPTLYTELLIPFYNFTRLNMEFWIKYMMSNPWLAAVLNDFMTPIWDFDSYSEDELNRNKSLQYQILAGNMPLDDSGFVFKANPSYMDVYNTFTDPQNAVLSKLVAPVQNAVSYEMAEGAFGYGMFADASNGQQQAQNVAEAIFKDSSSYPIIGAAIQRYLKAGDTYRERLEGHSIAQFLASALPGTFGATKQWEQFQRTRAVSKSGYLPYTYSGTYVWDHFYTNRFLKYAHRYHPRMFYPSRQRNPLERYYSKNWYSRYYTKKGQSRAKFRMQTTTAKNLGNRIHDFQLWR